MMTLNVCGKTITLFDSGRNDVPTVYLNTVQGEGASVWAACQAAGAPPFTLVAIDGIDWNREMSPWAAPAVMRGDDAFTGGADDYLKALTEQIIPTVEDAIGAPTFRALAGYSLAGLFAVYAAYQTDAFSRIASASGSFWFPKFLEYARTHELKSGVSHIYFSLGDKESRARNQTLAAVQEHTEQIVRHMKENGIDTTFVLHPGNHFHHPEERMAAGIAWMLGA